MKSWLFIALFLFAFLISAISPDTRNISHIIVLSALSVGLWQIFSTKSEVKTPPYFEPMVLFVIILQFSILFVTPKVNPLFNSLLFIEGLAFWLVAFNLKKDVLRLLPLMLLVPIGVYSLAYVLGNLFDINLVAVSLYLFTPNEANRHLLIGDFWAIAFAFILGKSLIQRSPGMMLLGSVGAFFLLISHSRTAYVVVFVVVMAMLYQRGKKWLVYMASTAFVSLFLYQSLFRSVIFSRPYFLQSILSFFKYPLGVGMGNFRIISEEFYYAGGVLSGFSEYAHNIFLEGVSGVGVFSAIFIYAFYKIIKDLIKNGDVVKRPWLLMFLSITGVFLLGQLYIVPGIFWLWFISLGVAQREISRT